MRAAVGRRKVGTREGFERLEPRVFLSGVTLITHGQFSGVGDWVSAMAGAVMARPEAGDAGIYKVVATDGGSSANPISVGVPQFVSGVRASLSHSEEIILELDWSAMAGAHVRSTVEVGLAVAAKFFDAAFLADLGHPLAELPLHLIGHSRGGSLVSEIAKDLGAAGVWVNQVSTLDPHPVNGTHTLEPNWGDATAVHWSNVEFFDNYYRKSGGFTVPDGDFVAGALNDPNTAGVWQDFKTALDSGGGYGSDHSDVHLWYHGTIDTATWPMTDGQSGVTPVPSTSTWYGVGNTLRPVTGFYYSRIANGVRPGGGIGDGFGGTGTTSPVTVTSLYSPNIDALNTAGQLTFSQGQSVMVTFKYANYGNSANILFHFDKDQNPYNGAVSSTPEGLILASGSHNVPTGGQITLDTASLAPGTYYIAGMIQDDHFRRIAYLPQKVIIEPRPGDANLDGMVDAFDLNILAANWQAQSGGSWLSGDFTRDGKVDAFDLNVLAAHWQEGVSLAAGQVAAPFVWPVAQASSIGAGAGAITVSAGASSPIGKKLKNGVRPLDPVVSRKAVLTTKKFNVLKWAWGTM